MSGTAFPKPTQADFERVEESAEYWDTHGLTDYLEFAPLDRGQRVAEGYRPVMIAPDLWERLALSAEARGMSVETLVALWLDEKVAA